MSEVSPEERRRQRFFLMATGLVVAGGLVGQLGATSATTLAGGKESGSFDTGLYIAISTVFAGLMAIRALPLAKRWGARTTWAWVNVSHSSIYLLVGILVLAYESDTVILFIAAPFFGTISGLLGVVSPLMTRSYLGGGMAHANSRRAAIAGVSGAVALLVGGALIHLVGPGIGMVLCGILGLPLLFVSFRVEPAGGNPEVTAPRHPLRTALRTAAKNEQLRLVSLLAIASALFTLPFAMLMVPILNDLDHDPVPSGAGLVLAGISLGKLLTPRVVDWLESRGRSDFVGALLAAVGLAVLLYLFGVVTPLLAGITELAVWMLIGVGFGALRATVISLNEGAAVRSLAKGLAAEGMAVLAIFATFAVPVGAFSWGWSIQNIGAIPTIWIGATLMLVAAVVLRILARGTIASQQGASDS
jgi:hypothetical protein